MNNNNTFKQKIMNKLGKILPDVKKNDKQKKDATTTTTKPMFGHKDMEDFPGNPKYKDYDYSSTTSKTKKSKLDEGSNPIFKEMLGELERNVRDLSKHIIMKDPGWVQGYKMAINDAAAEIKHFY